MISIRNYQDHLMEHYAPGRRRATVRLFVKALYVFLILKIIFLWPVFPDIINYLTITPAASIARLIYAPVVLAQFNPAAFLLVFLLILLTGLIVQPNFISGALIFWLSFCLSRSMGAILNGSDQVLNLLLLISIILTDRPSFNRVNLRTVQEVLSTYAFLLVRIQLSLIYLLSGFDKLISKTWRSGEAVYSIMNLEFYFNPKTLIHLPEWIYFCLAWTIILFELIFPILIWFRRTQISVLLVGVAFHLGIVFLLSLPDFGLVMIFALTVFLSEQTASKFLPKKKLFQPN